jgi:protocatechuate 3,4-dioxygenase beta subunit
MERKDFLRNSLGLMGAGAIILDACSKSSSGGSSSSSSTSTTTGSCIVSPEETEGPYPYPTGEINNPLNRADITESKTGIPLSLVFTVVNSNSSCAVISNARVDIWHCDKDGYYSGYANQPGYLGTQSFVGSTFLRGYVLTDSNGQAKFTTIYPGWYTGRATHIHIEVFINNVLKKTTQVAFSETISDAVHTSSLYSAHGVNNTRNASDNVFSDSISSELLTLSGSLTAGYTGTYTIGIAL